MSESDFVYNFPPMSALGSYTIEEQVNKLVEECREVLLAHNENELALETMDVIHACETLLRMLDVDANKLKKTVIVKNRVRGYYGE